MGLVVAELLGVMKLDKSKFDRDIDQSQSKFRSMGGKIAGVGDKMTLGLTLPIIAGGVAAAGAAKEAAQGQAQLGAVLKSTGGAANVTADDVNKVAAAIAETTLHEDDAVLAGQNMLLTFTKIRNEVGEGNDVFDQSTRVLADMSTALGTDMKQQAVQLGKALNDPIKGVTALGRAGVQFTDQQKEQIAKMVESGDILGAQKVILAELETQFGGSAKAAASTDWGKAQNATKELGEALESLGGALAPIVGAVARVVTPIARGFASLPEPVMATVGAFIALVAAVGPVMSIGGRLMANWDTLGRGASKLGEVAGRAFTSMKAGAASNAAASVKAALATGFAWLKMGAQALLAAGRVALSWVIALGPIALVIAAVVAVGILIIKNWDKVKRFLLATWRLIVRVAKAIWGALVAYFKSLIAFWTKTIPGAWNKVKDFLVGIWKSVWAFAKGIWKKITEGWRKLVDGIKGIASRLFEFIKTIPERIWNLISGLPRKLFGLGKDIIGGLIDGLKGAIGALWDFVSDIPGSIINKVKSGLGMGSPSKEFMKIGKFTIEGLNKGLMQPVHTPTVEFGGVRGAMAGGGALAGAGGVHVHFHGPVYGGRAGLRQVARDLVPEIEAEKVRTNRGRRGGRDGR